MNRRGRISVRLGAVLLGQDLGERHTKAAVGQILHRLSQGHFAEEGERCCQAALAPVGNHSVHDLESTRLESMVEHAERRVDGQTRDLGLRQRTEVRIVLQEVGLDEALREEMAEVTRSEMPLDVDQLAAAREDVANLHPGGDGARPNNLLVE